MSKNRLYHKDVYLPNEWATLGNNHCVTGWLSPHAIRSANSDRNGQIIIPKSFNFSGKNIIELETFENSKDVKIVLRLPYNKKCDLILVALFAADSNLIKTVWLNNKDDSHDTLKTHLYDTH